MSLILIGKNDITVGEPVAWPIYDQQRNLLLEQGSLIRDNEHHESLLARGAHRRLLPETTDREDGDNPCTAEKTPRNQTAQSPAGTRFTFDDMKLKVESKLQLEPPAQLGRERLFVKVIGYLRGVSLLVTAPATSSGFRPQLMEGERVVMRSFSGQNAFASACTIERVSKLPFEHLHLSFPDVIQGVMIRKTPRIKTRIIATISNHSNSPASALISNISANGLALDAKQPLGSKGDVISMAFRVNLHDVNAALSIKGLIRAVFDDGTADPSDPEIVRHGIEFQELQPNDRVILQSMIYQQIIESPHHLM